VRRHGSCLRGRGREGESELARDCRSAGGDRKRLETPGRLEPVYGVAPRLTRIDTLKCGEATARCVFGRGGLRWSKHTRGGRKPNE